MKTIKNPVQSYFLNRFKLKGSAASSLIERALSGNLAKRKDIASFKRKQINYIIKLNKLITTSDRSKSDFMERAEALAFRSRHFKKEDFLSCYSEEENTFNPLKLLEIIFSEQRIPDPVDRAVLRHRLLLYYGDKILTLDNLQSLLNETRGVIFKRDGNWVACTSSIIKELFLLKDYFPSSGLFTKNEKYVLLPDSFAVEQNKIFGVNFSLHFYKEFINKINSGKYTDFEINEDGVQSYLMAERSLLNGKDDNDLIKEICRRISNGYIQTMKRTCSNSQLWLLNKLSKDFNLEINYSDGYIIVSRLKTNAFTRSMREIVHQYKRIEIKELHRKMREAGHQVNSKTIRRLIRNKADTFVREGTQVYLVE